jgi:hypothetical protein
MGKAGGVIGIIAGVFGFIAAIVTLFVGGIGGAFDAEGAKTVVGLGWGGILFSFLAIVFGAVCFARPRGAGIGLIIVSILGAILGGTLVAICMALSLLGGILAVVGGKKTVAPTAQDSTAAAVSGKKSSVWRWVGGGAAALVVLLVAIGGLAPSKPKVDALAELNAAQTAPLQPEGALSELFAMGSKNTDLQRENRLKEIKGQVVQWTLPVYEVRRSGEGYKVQTKTKVRVGSFGTDLLGTFVYITPRSDDERRQIEALKTDDMISFKGYIAGSTLRSLQIKPAILAARGATTAAAPTPVLKEVTKPEASTVSASVSQSTPAPAEASKMTGTATQATWKPSFDCTKASTYSEKTICSDPLLGRLDGALSENYRHMLILAMEPATIYGQRKEHGCQSAINARITNASSLLIESASMKFATIRSSPGFIQHARALVMSSSGLTTQ